MSPKQVPKFDLRWVESTYRKIMIGPHFHVKKWDGPVLEEKSYDAYLNVVGDLLKIPIYTRDCLYLSAAPYYGRTISGIVSYRLAYRWSGGRKLLLEGKPLVDTYPASGKVWVALRIEEVILSGTTRKGNPLARTSLLIIEGEYSGAFFVQKLPVKYLTRILAKEIGFPKYKGTALQELCGMRLLGLIEFSVDRGPTLADVAGNSSVVGYNGKLRKNRAGKCPYELKHACHTCPRGYYGEKSCALATHLHSYTLGLCERCGKKSWMDRTVSTSVCLSCRTLETRKALVVL